MRALLATLSALAASASAISASASPSVDIRDAVARVIVSPEPRSDVRVEVVRANPRLPLHVWSFADHTFVDGGLIGSRIRDCSEHEGAPRVVVVGVGDVAADAMPQIVIHTPMDAHVSASGAVWGQIGRTESLDFANAGCGAWQIANVKGRLRIRQAGSGMTRAGLAAAAELSSAGSGFIATRDVAGPVVAMNVGSGDIDVGSLNGLFQVRIAGSGRVRAAGHASAMQAQVAGSGDVDLDGVADSLRVTVMGSGGVRVRRVTGPVSKAVVGSGDVRIGS